jgi:uncharacterized membrane protein
MNFSLIYGYSNKRNQTADLLKGLAVVFMILIHLFENIAANELSTSSFGRFVFFLGGPPAAPIFMIIMGFFLEGSKRSNISMIKRGALLFVGGILLNVGLNASLLIKIFTGEANLNPLPFIFGVDILPLAGLSIIIITLLKPIFKQLAEAYLAVSIIVVQLSYLFINYFQIEHSTANYLLAFIGGSYDWSYFPVLPWLSFPLIGFSLKLFYYRVKTDSFVKTSYINVFLVLFGLFFAFTQDYAINITATLPIYYKFGMTFFLWMLFFLAGYALLISIIEKVSSKNWILLYIKWIGENVTAFYVFQWLLIGNISSYLYQTETELSIMIIWFAGILVLTTIMVLIWKYFSVKKVEAT